MIFNLYNKNNFLFNKINAIFYHFEIFQSSEEVNNLVNEKIIIEKFYFYNKLTQFELS